MEQLQIVFDLLRMVRRRIVVIVLIAGLGIAASTFFAYILPAVFQSTARILVEDQQIPDQLARSTVTQTASQRLDTITQKLMSRPNLIKLIDDLGLYADRPDLSLSDKIERVRNATALIPITRPPPNNQMLSAFTIQVTMNDPELAARTANEFVTLVLDQNAQVRTRQATETLAFFEKETDRLRDTITALEEEITEYKRANEDALPGNLSFRHEQLNQMTDTALAPDNSIFQLEQQRDELQTRLAEIRDVTTGPASERPEQARLRAIESELAQLRTVYSDSHRSIQALLAERDAIRRSQPAGTGETQPSGGQPDTRRQQREEQILGRIRQLNSQIDSLQDEKNALAGQGERIRASIRRTPDVEVVLKAYDRRLEDLQDQLAGIVRKRAEAETGERLEVNQQAERFEVVENARMPEYPISPNRKKIAAMGAVASAGLALGFAFLLEMLFPAIRSVAQMQRQLDLRPVVAIPHIRTRAERRMGFIRGAAMLLVLGVAIPGGLYFVDQKVMPLQKIGEKVVEKTGMSEFIRIIESRF